MQLDGAPGGIEGGLDAKFFVPSPSLRQIKKAPTTNNAKTINATSPPRLRLPHLEPSNLKRSRARNATTP